MRLIAERSGRYVQQPSGYRAFVPAPLPVDPPIQLDPELVQLLASATLAVGRLDGVGERLPDPDLFVAMYVRREAVLSSQIEGTQSTLDDILTFELDPERAGQPRDVHEVVNYVRALNYGLQRLNTLPLSLRLIREIHRELMTGVRGSEQTPGEFRRSQNWIGGASPATARFVPPAPTDMLAALDNFERFLHDDGGLPDLIYCAIAHAQFETIHPFLDGNGRVGRLLIALLLCHRGALRLPLLYLSHYLKGHQSEYYDRLMAIRTADGWEGWVHFFLEGVLEAATEATATARNIAGLYRRHEQIALSLGWGDAGQRLLDLLCRQPLTTVGALRDALELPDKTTRRLIERVVKAGILEEVTGGRRNRIYRYSAYIALFEDAEARPVNSEP
ncbi:MAG: Fic family protein [Dehalococcoidia bacterium]